MTHLRNVFEKASSWMQSTIGKVLATKSRCVCSFTQKRKIKVTTKRGQGTNPSLSPQLLMMQRETRRNQVYSNWKRLRSQSSEHRRKTKLQLRSVAHIQRSDWTEYLAEAARVKTWKRHTNSSKQQGAYQDCQLLFRP